MTNKTIDIHNEIFMFKKLIFNKMRSIERILEIDEIFLPQSDKYLLKVYYQEIEFLQVKIDKLSKSLKKEKLVD